MRAFVIGGLLAAVALAGCMQGEEPVSGPDNFGNCPGPDNTAGPTNDTGVVNGSSEGGPVNPEGVCPPGGEENSSPYP